MDKPEYNKKYNMRLPQELYDRIVELGNAYERSANEQLVYMLKTWQEPAKVEDRLARIEGKVFRNET
jgi:predicted DNA-binding protein